MPKVLLITVPCINVEQSYLPSKCYEVFGGEGSLYAKITHYFPVPYDGIELKSNESCIEVGDVVLLGIYNLVIWLNDGNEMSFEDADNYIRVVPLGEQDVVTLTF